MSLVGFFLARPALVLMNTDPAILEDAVIYLKVTAIGFICVGMYNGVSSILRALGDTKTPLTFNCSQFDKCSIRFAFCTPI